MIHQAHAEGVPGDQAAPCGGPAASPQETEERMTFTEREQCDADPIGSGGAINKEGPPRGRPMEAMKF